VDKIHPDYAEARREAGLKKIRGWRALLRAVLDQAIEDWRHERERYRRRGVVSGPGREVDAWFFGAPREPEVGLTFERLCELLELEPGRIRRQLRGTITPKGARRHFARGSREGHALYRSWASTTPFQINAESSDSRWA